MNALAPIVADDRANPGEPRSALGAGRRRGRVLEAAERRVDRRLAAAAGDAQGDLRAGRRARHAPREVVRALDRLALEGDDDVAGPHPSGMLTLTATPMPQSLPARCWPRWTRPRWPTRGSPTSRSTTAFERS